MDHACFDAEMGLVALTDLLNTGESPDGKEGRGESFHVGMDRTGLPVPAGGVPGIPHLVRTSPRADGPVTVLCSGNCCVCLSGMCLPGM